MITAIEIENFKCIKDRVRFELRPITLLFGPNSAGKSTVIQALHYAREIFERRNFNPDRTLAGGEAVDLGGFTSLVHKGDLSKPIILRLDLDLKDVDLPEYELNYWAVESRNEARQWNPFLQDKLEYERYIAQEEDVPLEWRMESDQRLSREIETAWVEVEIAWSAYFGVPFAARYSVGINGVFFATIDAPADERQVTLHNANLDHPLLVKQGEAGDLDSKFGMREVLWAFEEALDHGFNYSDPEFICGLHGQNSALPVWERLLGIPDLSEDIEELDPLEWLHGKRFLTQAIVGPGELLRDHLRRFRYLGPLRKIPPRGYEPPKSPVEARWANGLAAWDLLHERDGEFLNQVSEWMAREDRLSTGYSLRMHRLQELPAHLKDQLSTDDELEVMEQIIAEIRRLCVKKRLMLIEEKWQLEVLPQDVGVGISQVLPVVVAAMDKGADLVAIEQPELHIHPAIQVELGDLFIEQIQGGLQTFLIETHSEHLMLRLLRRIEEKTENEIPPGKVGLNPDQVAVHFVESGEDGMKVHHLRIDETGEFKDRWPKGFFDERGKELFR